MKHANHDEVEALIRARGYAPDARLLLAALEDVQAGFGCVSEAAVDVLGAYFDVPSDTVRALIHACNGALVMESDAVEEARTAPLVEICNGAVCRREFEALAGAAAASGLSCRRVFCMGACDRAPAIRFRGEVMAPADAALMRALADRIA